MCGPNWGLDENLSRLLGLLRIHQNSDSSLLELRRMYIEASAEKIAFIKWINMFITHQNDWLWINWSSQRGNQQNLYLFMRKMFFFFLHTFGTGRYRAYALYDFDWITSISFVVRSLYLFSRLENVPVLWWCTYILEFIHFMYSYIINKHAHLIIIKISNNPNILFWSIEIICWSFLYI